MSRVYLEATRAQLEAQEQQRNSLNQRAITYFGFSTVLLTVLIALSAATGRLLPGIGYIFLALAGLAYLVLLLAAYEALRIREWSARPDLRTLEGYAGKLDEERLARWVGWQYRLSVEANEPGLREKAEAVQWALGSTLALSLSLTLAVFSRLVAGGG